VADRKPFDTDELSRGLENLFGRAVDALSKGREEILKQSRIGKVKLFDLSQLRRERAQLVLRLGEEAYRAMQSGMLSRTDLDRTYKRIVEMDERIAAKEAEVEKIRRQQQGPTSSSSSQDAAPKKSSTGASRAAKKRPDRPRKTLGHDDEDA
jgi:hypothetical protein